MHPSIHGSVHLCIRSSVHPFIHLDVFVYTCTTVTISTFMVSGRLCRDKMANLGKLDDSGILKIQRIYLCVKTSDLISYSQELLFRFEGT